MKKALVVFGLTERFLHAGVENPVVYGIPVAEGDVVAYLFEDAEPPQEACPPDLTDLEVILWQHTGGARNHEAQQAWISRGNPQRICLRPSFSHEGKNLDLFKKIFVDRDQEVLKALIQEYSADEALDLAENALAWNALVNWLSDEASDDAGKKRDYFSKLLFDSRYTEDDYSDVELGPEWEAGLRGKLKDFAGMRRDLA